MKINLKALEKAKTYELTIPDLENTITGEFEKKLRESLGFSQNSMAVMLHVKKKTIEKWEQGVNPIKGGSAVALYLIDQQPSLVDLLYCRTMKNVSMLNFSAPTEIVYEQDAKKYVLAIDGLVQEMHEKEETSVSTCSVQGGRKCAWNPAAA